MKWILKKTSVKDLKENSKNPRTLTKKGLSDLEQSIKKFGIAEPLVVNTDMMICGGHGRKKILERLNIKEVDCYFPEKKLTEKKFNELGIRLNKNIAGEFDFDILANDFEINDLIEWGFEETEFDVGLKKAEEKELSEKATKLKLPETDYYFYSFSGGQDSTLAFLYTIEELKKQKKQIEILFVNTGAEFNSVYSFADRLIRSKGMELTVINSNKTFQEIYCKKNVWPDNIFRECIELLISNSLDSYIKKKIPDTEYVLIRGGRSDQKKTQKGLTKGDRTFQRIKNKPLMTIWNPLYNLEKEKYSKLIKEISLWEGYSKGYERTACWCCPFQKHQQWETMKINDPLLFNEMKRLSETLDKKLHPLKKGKNKGKDTFWVNFDKYWRNQDYI